MNETVRLRRAIRILEQFSNELGQYCAGLRLAQHHLPIASSPDECDGHQLLDLLLAGLNELHGCLEEELSLFPLPTTIGKKEER